MAHWSSVVRTKLVLDLVCEKIKVLHTSQGKVLSDVMTVTSQKYLFPIDFHVTG